MVAVPRDPKLVSLGTDIGELKLWQWITILTVLAGTIVIITKQSGQSLGY